ncbi:MAG: hypothetical protein HY264_04435 [Chloroflexi bacterium]|nr:hypothetical protein [Chloroflexota bacterium]
MELALAGRLGWFWIHHTHLTEGRRLLDRALSGTGGDELDRARCLCAAGTLASMQGGSTDAFESIEAGLAVLRRRGELVEECAALDDYGWAMFFQNDNAGAMVAFERAVQLADQSGIPGLIRRANTGLCQVIVANGDVDRGRDLAQQLLRISGGDLWTSHLAHHFVADCALFAGDPGAALPSYRVALELAQRMGNAVETAIEIQGVAMAAAGSGAAELGIRLNAAAEAAFVAIGFDFDVPWWSALLERYLGPARLALGDEAGAIDREGRTLSLNEAVSEALERSRA